MDENQRSWLQAVRDGIMALFGNWEWPYAPLARGILFVVFAIVLLFAGMCINTGCSTVESNVGNLEVIGQGESLQDALHEAYLAAGGGTDDLVFNADLVEWYLLYADVLTERLLAVEELTALDLLKAARVREGVADVRASFDSPAYVRQRCLSLSVLAATIGHYDSEEGLDTAAEVIEAAIGDGE